MTPHVGPSGRDYGLQTAARAEIGPSLTSGRFLSLLHSSGDSGHNDEPTNGLVMRGGLLVLSYDEGAIRSRIAGLPRVAKTAFAAACAQRLLPAFGRYASAAGLAPDVLAAVVDATWDTIRTGEGDLSDLQEQAEELVPRDDGEWSHEMGYGQNGAAAAAYAVRTWLTDDPQQAVWAARQVYEAADYAALAAAPELDVNAPDTEDALRSLPTVQAALAGIEADLSAVERSDDWDALRRRTTNEGRQWVQSLP